MQLLEKLKSGRRFVHRAESLLPPLPASSGIVARVLKSGGVLILVLGGGALALLLFLTLNLILLATWVSIAWGDPFLLGTGLVLLLVANLWGFTKWWPWLRRP